MLVGTWATENFYKSFKVSYLRHYFTLFSIEPILPENPSRFNLFPIQDDEAAWAIYYYKKAQASIWTAEENLPPG